MVEIQCVACEKAIKPRQLNDTDNYDTENYDGQIVCQECKSLLYVKSVKGKVQKSKVVERSRPREQKLNIIVQDEETKQILQGVSERTGKLGEGGGTQGVGHLKT